MGFCSRDRRERTRRASFISFKIGSDFVKQTRQKNPPISRFQEFLTLSFLKNFGTIIISIIIGEIGFMNALQFFTESLRHFKTIGTVIPSSRASVKKMIEPVDFTRPRLIIVELGAGTGPITKEMLAMMRPDAKLIVFEINSSFINALKQISDSRLIIMNDSAANMIPRLGEQGITKADYVISTLPLAQIKARAKTKILKAIFNALRPGGRYVQIQYSLLSMNELKKRFSVVKINFTLFNFPPAFFYVCER